MEKCLWIASFQEEGARATLRATLLGEPDVREGYDLGGTVVRMCGVCSHTIARLLFRPRSGESSNASRYGSGMGGAPGLEREMGCLLFWDSGIVQSDTSYLFVDPHGVAESLRPVERGGERVSNGGYLERSQTRAGNHESALESYLWKGIVF
jgi:hypothetical protein